jgi:hypothetical protein
VSVNDCVFSDNSSPLGGGLLVDASIVELVSSEFIGNTGTVGCGSYLYASDVVVESSVFDKNIGQEGAGLYIADSEIWLAKNRFTANLASSYGAGLFINGAPLAVYPQSVINNLFSDNSAGLAGGGLVTEGGSDVEVVNCTFAENIVTDPFGYAAGLLAHDTFVDVKNTIFWDNLATFGPQIVVGDPYEFGQPYDPDYIPYSTVFVDYSDVQGGETELFVSDGEWPWAWYGSSNIEDDPATEEDESDPLFEVISEPVFKFFLSQFPVQSVKSPCVDAGDGTADDLNSEIEFIGTTRTDYGADGDEVDMGYHYSSVETELCAYADLALNGIVSLDDLIFLASYWLGQCDSANSWCAGSDFNFDNGVDLYDYAFLAGCWLVFDEEPPSPDPAQWEVAPRPVENTSDQIIMEAVQATDNWSFLGVEYKFQNLTNETDTGWRQGYDSSGADYVSEPWMYIESGLQDGTSYTYTVTTRDIAGNMTVASVPGSAIPGLDTNPPSPNPSQWAIEPYQSGLNAASMEAVHSLIVMMTLLTVAGSPMLIMKRSAWSWMWPTRLSIHSLWWHEMVLRRKTRPLGRVQFLWQFWKSMTSRRTIRVLMRQIHFIIRLNTQSLHRVWHFLEEKSGTLLHRLRWRMTAVWSIGSLTLTLTFTAVVRAETRMVLNGVMWTMLRGCLLIRTTPPRCRGNTLQNAVLTQLMKGGGSKFVTGCNRLSRRIIQSRRRNYRLMM